MKMEIAGDDGPSENIVPVDILDFSPRQPDRSEPFDWDYVVHQLLKGKLDDTYIEECVRKLSRIVCLKHYGFYPPSFREELERVGTVKAYQLFGVSHFDPKRPVKPFLYAGMRNEMTNYIARNCKEVEMPDSITEFEITDTSSDIYGSIDMGFDTILTVFSKFDSTYRSYIPYVVEDLEIMGFRLVDVPLNIRQYPDIYPYYKDSLYKSVADKLLCMTIWEKVDGTP